MKLRDFNFNSINDDFLRPAGPVTLAIRMGDGRWYQGFTIGDTLRMIPDHFADASIKEIRWFFNVFVIELEELEAGT